MKEAVDKKEAVKKTETIWNQIKTVAPQTKHVEEADKENTYKVLLKSKAV